MTSLASYQADLARRPGLVLAVHFETQYYTDQALWIMLEEVPENKQYSDNRSGCMEHTEVMEERYGKVVCTSWEE